MCIRDSYLAERGVSVYEKWECHSSASIKSAVMGGQGLSVISRRLVEREIAEKKLYPLALQEVVLIRPFSLIYHKNKYLSTPLQALMDECRALGAGR